MQLEEKVEVLDRYENVIAVFKKDDANDEDKMINPIVNLLQNGDCTFSFQISINSKKWQEIQSVENFYRVNGRVFSPKFDGAYIEDLSSSNQNLITVNCYERQNLLQREYVRAWNSETGFENIDDFMVVIVSGGDLPLKNNAVEVNPTYTIGTAGYILEGLLFNTDWSVGTVDVEGTYDFETDMVDVYNNVLKVQEMFGGILVWDSLNKIVHLRDELKYRNYTGYEVRWKKNMDSLTKRYNNKIITRLIPLGEAGLNIKSVNNGVNYLENYDYSPVVSSEIVNNDDIYEPEQLKAWGERKLKDLSRPSKEMTVSLKDLRQVKGYELEEFDLNDIVDVIDYKGIEGREQLRVISWQYNIFAIYDSVVELGDTTLNTTDIFRQISSATSDIINGTISSSKVVNIKTGGTLEANMIRIDEIIITNKVEQEATNEKLETRLYETEVGIDNLNGITQDMGTKISSLTQTVESISQTIKISGGTNKVINSVGLYGDDQYQIVGGVIKDAYFGEDGNLKTLTDSGAKVQPANNQKITHSPINLIMGNIYTLTMKISNDNLNNLKFSMTGTKPLEDQINDYVDYTNGIATIVDTTEEKKLQEFVYKFKVTGEVTYTIESYYDDNTKRGFYTDLIIVDGDNRSSWESAKNEIIGTALTIYYNGIEVTSFGSNIKTIINNTGFSVVDLQSTEKILLTLNNTSIFLGADTEIKGTLTIQNFLLQDFLIEEDDILMLV